MSVFDRVKADLLAVIGGARARSVDWFGLYRAKVVKQSSDMKTVDLNPEDARLPQHVGIPLKAPLPGTRAAVPVGSWVLLGWERGDPSRPYAAIWDDGITPTKIVVDAAAIYIGGETGAEPTVKGTSYNSALSTFLTALGAYATAIQAIADPTNVATPILSAALTAFGTASSAAQTVKAKVA